VSPQSPSLIYFLYLAAFSLAALGCFVSVPRVQRITDRDTRRGLLALLLTSGGWATAQVGYLVASTTRLTIVWYVIGLVLGLAAVGAWLYFCSAYTNRTYHRNKTYRRLGVGVFLALVAVKLTNPLHHGYFVTTAVSTPFPHLSITTGPLHWTAMGLSYALAFIGYFMLLELFTEIDQDTRPLMVLVGITGLPVVVDLIGYTSPVLIDMTYEPIGVAIFAVSIAFVYLDRFDAVQLASERDTPIIALDRDSNVRDTNHAARTLFPSLATANGSSIEAVLPTIPDRLESDDPILKVEESDGTRYFRVTETPYGTTKSGLGSTLIFTDVTESEESRQELERQNDRLEQFASLVSHDLRNPLNVAQGNLELLQEDLPPDKEHAAEIEDAHRRMETLIEDILTLARHGKQVEQWDAVRLSTLVTECWEMVDTPDTGLTIEDDLVFEADSERLKRLLENLFRNTIDHGDTATTITVGALPDRVGFYIADDGIGIPAAERDHVFETGYTTSTDGTGFGLSIVADIVAAHGWQIQVTESADGGARFEITGVSIIE
jgi:signal transduction histidine kinase